MIQIQLRARVQLVSNAKSKGRTMSVHHYVSDCSLTEEVQRNNRILSRPLVGARWLRREPSPLLARDPDRHRQSRYMQGFDPDWWLSALQASKWKSRWYPLKATRESIEQWREWTEATCVEYLGPFQQPETAQELESDLLHDLALIRECAPHLTDDKDGNDSQPQAKAGDGGAKVPAVQPTDATEIQAAADSSAEKLTAVERAVQIFLRDTNQSKREVARKAGCNPSLLSRDGRFKQLWEAYNRSLPKGSKSKDGTIEAEAE
jgi:hypothetical protein